MKVMVFDVGGTGIKYSVMDEQLNRTDTGSTPTPADSQEHFLNTLREIYLPHKDEVDGIALSLPGFIDAEQGVVKGGGAPSLAYNVGTPVGPRLAEACGCRVWIENDGKAAAIAELERGVLKGCRNAAVFTIGTGVGGGLSAVDPHGAALVHRPEMKEQPAAPEKALRQGDGAAVPQIFIRLQNMSHPGKRGLR